MARKLRLEYEGATYHVINRGNYRRPIFESDGAMASFEKCLFEACEKSAWILHAFVLMINHFHLALETPQGNLVVGMHWLLGTYGNRFNRFRGENGHLFQGRYKAYPIGEPEYLGETCDYIHSNPVAAGVISLERLGEYRHSSYWYLRNPGKRPEFLRPQTALECADNIPDNRDGWLQYDERLGLQLEEDAAHGGKGRRERETRLCQGWAIGSDEFKQALIRDYNLHGNVRAWENPAVIEIRQARWATELGRALQLAGRSQPQALNDRKKALWKLAIAAWMKAHTQASNRWLAANLNLGIPTAVSHNLTQYRRNFQASDPLWHRLKTLNST